MSTRARMLMSMILVSMTLAGVGCVPQDVDELCEDTRSRHSCKRMAEALLGHLGSAREEEFLRCVSRAPEPSRRVQLDCAGAHGHAYQAGRRRGAEVSDWAEAEPHVSCEELPLGDARSLIASVEHAEGLRLVVVEEGDARGLPSWALRRFDVCLRAHLLEADTGEVVTSAVVETGAVPFRSGVLSFEQRFERDGELYMWWSNGDGKQQRNHYLYRVGEELEPILSTRQKHGMGRGYEPAPIPVRLTNAREVRARFEGFEGQVAFPDFRGPKVRVMNDRGVFWDLDWQRGEASKLPEDTLPLRIPEAASFTAGLQGERAELEQMQTAFPCEHGVMHLHPMSPAEAGVEVTAGSPVRLRWGEAQTEAAFVSPQVLSPRVLDERLARLRGSVSGRAPRSWARRRGWSGTGSPGRGPGWPGSSRGARWPGRSTSMSWAGRRCPCSRRRGGSGDA